MCEFSENHRKRDSVNYFIGHPNSMIARAVLERFPYAFKDNLCPRCGKHLQPWEQRPEGRATRCMCTHDYNTLIPNRVGSYECLVCGGGLPDHKIRAQHGNAREVSNHIHDGECMHLWTLIHNVSIGEPDVVAMFQQPFIPYHAQVEYTGQAHCWEPQRLPIPSPSKRLLPPPQPQVRYGPHKNHYLDRVPVRRVRRGRPIKQVLTGLIGR
jgi:hypothetical protein